MSNLHIVDVIKKRYGGDLSWIYKGSYKAYLAKSFMPNSLSNLNQ